MVLTDNIARFQTKLIENKSSPKTTLRENETTLFEYRLITSGWTRLMRIAVAGFPPLDGAVPCAVPVRRSSRRLAPDDC